LLNLVKSNSKLLVISAQRHTNHWPLLNNYARHRQLTSNSIYFWWATGHIVLDHALL